MRPGVALTKAERDGAPEYLLVATLAAGPRAIAACLVGSDRAARGRRYFAALRPGDGGSIRRRFQSGDGAQFVAGLRTVGERHP